MLCGCGALKINKGISDFELTTKFWEDFFLSKGRDFSEGFLDGYKKSRSPLESWFRKYVLLEQNARVIGAKNALEKLKG